jgi:hypothetical protein
LSPCCSSMRRECTCLSRVSSCMVFVCVLLRWNDACRFLSCPVGQAIGQLKVKEGLVVCLSCARAGSEVLQLLFHLLFAPSNVATCPDGVRHLVFEATHVGDNVGCHSPSEQNQGEAQTRGLFERDLFLSEMDRPECL